MRTVVYEKERKLLRTGGPPTPSREVVGGWLKGPRKTGYRTDLWTCRRVAEVIAKTFDVEYHSAHVWKILHELGWTCQKPERRARERNEAAIAHWRKHECPRIKKGHTGIAIR